MALHGIKSSKIKTVLYWINICKNLITDEALKHVEAAIYSNPNLIVVVSIEDLAPEYLTQAELK